jgi:hypothetical protein
LFAPDVEPRDVIAVLVRHENAIDLDRIHTALPQSEKGLPRTQPAIDQQTGILSLHERGVS